MGSGSGAVRAALGGPGSGFTFAAEQSRWGRKEKPREPVPRPWQSWSLMPRPLVYAKQGHSRGRAAPGQLLEPRASTLTPRAQGPGRGRRILEGRGSVDPDFLRAGGVGAGRERGGRARKE